MANNRMYLWCKSCDDEFLLAKFYPSMTNGWFIKGADDYCDRLEAFLERHSFCGRHTQKMYGNVTFGLKFEVVPAPPEHR